MLMPFPSSQTPSQSESASVANPNPYSEILFALLYGVDIGHPYLITFVLLSLSVSVICWNPFVEFRAPSRSRTSAWQQTDDAESHFRIFFPPASDAAKGGSSGARLTLKPALFSVLTGSLFPGNSETDFSQYST